MLITIASTRICSVCASTMGRAVKPVLVHIVLGSNGLQAMSVSKHTHSHDHEESSQEPAQFHNAAASRVHKVIIRLRFAAYPVRHRRKHVGCDHEQGEEVVVEGGGEDDENEADGEDLSMVC
jgi:hypothetical protein